MKNFVFGHCSRSSQFEGHPAFTASIQGPEDLTIWNYPGGEVGVQFMIEPDQNALIAKIRSSDDIMALLQIASMMENKRDLILPYFPYARQDRVTGSMPFALGCVVDLIDGLGFKNVWCLDPHSPVLGARWRSTKFNVIGTSGLDLELDVLLHSEKTAGRKVLLMAPDAGAIKRVAVKADIHKIPMTNAWKVRDPSTGKLSLSLKKEQIPEGTDTVIVLDDICDGGSTFQELAKAVRAIDPKISLDLLVSHGIFSGAAVSKLLGYRTVVTTDSFHDDDAYNDLRVKFSDRGTHLIVCKAV